MYNCFASTNKGLEQILVEELATLGAINLTLVNAGVRFGATMNTIMNINLNSR